MKAVLVYNEKNKMISSLKENLQHLKCRDFLIDSKNTKNSFTIAQEINEMVDNEEVILFIDVNINFRPQHDFYYGIEILKEIRARFNFSKPNLIQRCQVVLFSIFSLKRLLSMDPGFFIIVSPGTTFIEMPYDPKSLNIKDISKKKIQDVKVLKPFFKVVDRTFEERHSYANWWAANRLKTILNQFLNKDSFSSNPLSNVPALRDAQFIYSVDDWDFKSAKKESLKKRIRRFQNGFKKSQLRILLVDDQADQIEFESRMGWKDLYADLIFKKDRRLSSISIEKTNEQILDQIDESYQCILLDLMLSKSDYNLAVEETRGAKLLGKIKSKYPMLPVIVTTASNKAEKRKTLRQLGCDAYWIKEGIDEQLSTEESIERNVHLLDLINKLTGKNYTFLRKCMLLIRNIEQSKMWWEEDIAWTNEKKKIDKPQVIKILMQCLYLLRTYLHNQVLGEGYRTKLEENFWLAGVIIKLACIIEEFHSTTGQNITTSMIKNRNDQLGEQLYKVRHEAAHYNNKYVIDFDLLEVFLSGMLCYLSTPPARKHKISSKKNNIFKLLKLDSNYEAIYMKYFF